MSSKPSSRLSSEGSTGPLGTGRAELAAALGFVALVAVVAGAASPLPVGVAPAAAVVLPLAVAVVARPVYGLYLVVPAVMLSPEFAVGQLPFRALELRVEDALVAAMVLGVLRDEYAGRTDAFAVLRRHLSRLRPWRPVDAFRRVEGVTAFALVVAPAAVFAALLGVTFANAVAFQSVHPLQSLLYTAKYVEYLCLFALVPLLVRTRRQYRLLALAFVASGLAVAATAVVEAALHYTTPVTLGWVSEPGKRRRFLGFYTNPTVFGSFVALVFPVGVTAALGAREWPLLRRLGAALAVVSVPALLVSGGRAPVIGALVALATVALVPVAFDREGAALSRRRAAALLVGGVVAFAVLIAVGAAAGVEAVSRLAYFFTHPLSLPGVETRVTRWNGFLGDEFRHNPILGSGVPTAPWFSSYYVRILVEHGAVTFLALCWLLAAVGRALLAVERDVGGWESALALGAVGATAGFLVVNVTAEMLTVTQTAQTFWFLVGLVVAAPRVSGAATEG
ncbi:MAG: O-antigen ligase family protein [Haloarculaceae archaeon]